jgi:hypothetical protein
LKARRGHDRFVRRLETEFTAENKNYRGISSDLSVSGLFIRTQHAFVPDTLIDIVIHLPDSTEVKLRGRVRRSIKTPVVSIKNGMGIEILENDSRYVNFVKSAFPGTLEEPDTVGPAPDTSFRQQADETPPPQPPPPEFTIITCPHCGVRNRVITVKLSLGPKCGKCGSLLTARD